MNGWFKPARAAALLGALVLAGTARAELVDRVVAVVNRDIIALSEVEQRAAPDLAALAQRERDPLKRQEARQALLARALDILIGERLIEEEAAALGITASNEDVQASVDAVKAEQNWTDEQLEAALRTEGLDMRRYRQMLAKNVVKTRIVQMRVAPRVKVEEDDLKAEYQAFVRREADEGGEVHARHILVQVPPNAPPAQVEAAKKKAEAIAAEARKPGMDFAALARARSEGPTAKDGGDLGFFRRGTMLPAFERAAFSTPVGQVADPVRSNFGWHVLKVEEKRATEVPPFEEVKDKLAQRLRAQKSEKFVEDYVRELRAKAAVQVKL